MYDHLPDLARRLGHYMAEQCADGLPGHFDDGLLKAFPDDDHGAIRAALAELEADGLVTLSHAIGPKLPRVRTTVVLFSACDAAITGHDPVEDAVTLAERLIADPKLGGTTSKLEAAVGWDRRRFNPAFALLIPCVAPGRVRSSIQNIYPTMGVLLNDEDIVRLRRYAERNRR